MANAYIQEYKQMAVDSAGRPLGIPHVGLGVTSQVVAFTGTAGSSQAFRKSTRFIRVLSDTACHFSVSDSPTAITSVSPKMAANVYEYFGVTPGEKISFVT